MKPLIGLLFILTVSGCAHTPETLMQNGTKSEHTLTLPHLYAAGCIARNIERNWNLVSVRPINESQTDVILPTWAYITVIANGTGSKATIYTRVWEPDAFAAASVLKC